MKTNLSTVGLAGGLGFNPNPRNADRLLLKDVPSGLFIIVLILYNIFLPYTPETLRVSRTKFQPV